mmetsp:Transcript_20311/g.59896  ORF Transcript_20311/g.59896 Transcript_20311/m.59896 type:complete len:273 (-) Transcript_20311:94-912(-)
MRPARAPRVAARLAVARGAAARDAAAGMRTGQRPARLPAVPAPPGHGSVPSPVPAPPACRTPAPRRGPPPPAVPWLPPPWPFSLPPAPPGPSAAAPAWRGGRRGPEIRPSWRQGTARSPLRATRRRPGPAPRRLAASPVGSGSADAAAAADIGGPRPRQTGGAQRRTATGEAACAPFGAASLGPEQCAGATPCPRPRCAPLPGVARVRASASRAGFEAGARRVAAALWPRPGRTRDCDYCARREIRGLLIGAGPRTRCPAHRGLAHPRHRGP